MQHSWYNSTLFYQQDKIAAFLIKDAAIVTAEIAG